MDSSKLMQYVQYTYLYVCMLHILYFYCVQYMCLGVLGGGNKFMYVCMYVCMYNKTLVYVVCIYVTTLCVFIINEFLLISYVCTYAIFPIQLYTYQYVMIVLA